MVSVDAYKMGLLAIALAATSYTLQGCDSGELLADVASGSWMEVGKGKCIHPQDGSSTEFATDTETDCKAECEKTYCDAYAFAEGSCHMVSAPLVGFPALTSKSELNNLGFLEGKTDSENGNDKFTCYRKMACDNFKEGTYHNAGTYDKKGEQFDVKVVNMCDLHFTYAQEDKVGYLLGSRLLVKDWHLGHYVKNSEKVVEFSDNGRWFSGPYHCEEDDEYSYCPDGPK